MSKKTQAEWQIPADVRKLMEWQKRPLPYTIAWNPELETALQVERFSTGRQRLIIQRPWCKGKLGMLEFLRNQGLISYERYWRTLFGVYRSREDDPISPYSVRARTRDLFHGCCAKCGVPCHDRGHLDHHVAFSRGGTLSGRNCVWLCPSCNIRKADKLPEHFYTPDELKKVEGILQSV